MIERIRGTASGGTRAPAAVGAVVAAFALAASAAAAPGSTDSSFGDGGNRAIDFPISAHASVVLPQADGKVVAVGTEGPTSFALARYEPDETLDPSFGDGGRVVTPVGSPLGSPAAALQPDGGLVVAGAVEDARGSILVVRYLHDGSIDASFGAGGQVQTELGGGAAVGSVTIEQDGKILVGASADGGSALVRYGSDGSPDPSFGAGGVVRHGSAPAGTPSPGAVPAQPQAAPSLRWVAEDFATAFTPVDARPLALGMDSAGRILVAGSVSLGGTAHAALARFNGAGALDGSFGDDGRVVAPFGEGFAPARVEAAAVQGDGSVLLAGTTRGSSAVPSGFALSRFTSDGSVDDSFGGGQVVTTSFAGAARATDVALQPDGKAIVVGTVRRGDRTSLALVRYNRDGTLDPSFGLGGKIVLPGAGYGPRGAVAERGGRLVIADGVGGINLVGLTSSGRLDPAFGRGGRLATPLGDRSMAEGVVAAGRKLVVYGESGGRIALARYRADGSLDRSFGRRGLAVSSIPAFAAGTDHALIQPHGRIAVVGSRRGRFAVARFNRDGSRDRAFGSGGQAISDVRGRASVVDAGPSQGILVAGSPPSGNDGRFVLARFGGGGGGQASDASARRAAAKPRRPHRLGPPNPVPAWYINAANFKELKRFAAQDACKFARTQPQTAKRTLILDFGGARAYRDGSFGAAVNNATFEATNQQIRAALKTAADAYATCHRRGQATIAYANTNHFGVQSVAVHARQIGVHQAQTVAHVADYLHTAGYAPAVRGGVAGDIEMGYWGPSRSKAMVNGAESVRRHGYMDFGTASGCPPYLKGQRRPPHHKCLNDWTLDDVAHASNAGGGQPLPEIYYRGGGYHYDQAAQWGSVARRWNSNHATAFFFFGATGSTEFSGLAPGASWKRLKAKTTGHVGRELVNFRQDHWKPVPTATGPDGPPG